VLGQHDRENRDAIFPQVTLFGKEASALNPLVSILCLKLYVSDTEFSPARIRVWYRVAGQMQNLWGEHTRNLNRRQ